MFVLEDAAMQILMHMSIADQVWILDKYLIELLHIIEMHILYIKLTYLKRYSHVGILK